MTVPEPKDAQPRAAATWLLWLTCLIPLAGAIRLVTWYWPGALPLDVTSGVWFGLARDFADGILYRPLISDLGYGGTRYMPLFFVAHGGLIRSGIDAVTAGWLLMGLAVVLFDAGLYAVLREIGVRRSLAVPLCVLGHATVSVQLLTLHVKCDLLASAFNLWGLTWALRYCREGRPTSALAALGLLTAAVLTKITTVSGIVGGLVAVWTRRGRAAGLIGIAMVALSLVAAATLVYLASEGRVWQSFSAVASGGLTASYGYRFAWWFALVVIQDPFFLLIFLAATVYAIDGVLRASRSFPTGYFWLTLVLTLAVFGSPGTDNNHLIDLLGASIVLIGHRLEQAPGRAGLALALPAVLAGLTLVTWIPGVVSPRSLIERGGRPQRQNVEMILRREGPAAGILSENPIIPVLAGERPSVSDPFSLRILTTRDSATRADFERRMTSGTYRAVVLVDYSGSQTTGDIMPLLFARADRGVESFYGGVHFPSGFLNLLNRYYQQSFIAPPFVVFERR